MKMRLPAVNIQYPISQLIISGDKTIETRTYPLPSFYLNRDLFFIETPGNEGDFSARIVGVINFESSYKYKSKNDFYADFSQHLIDRDSKWAWNDKSKWAWKISKVEIFKKTYDAPTKKGIIFTKEVILKGPL